PGRSRQARGQGGHRRQRPRCRRGGARAAQAAAPGRRRHAADTRRGLPALHGPPVQRCAAAIGGRRKMATVTRHARSVARPKTTRFTDTWYLTGRKLHALDRQPAVLTFSVIQPVIWLFLFGALFHKVIDIPGFAYQGSYLAYLVPGIVAMNAMSNNMWA